VRKELKEKQLGYPCRKEPYINITSTLFQQDFFPLLEVPFFLMLFLGPVIE